MQEIINMTLLYIYDKIYVYTDDKKVVGRYGF